MQPFLSRKDVPHVLVGGIQNISCTKEEVKIVGDRHLNFLMDKAFEALVVKEYEDEEKLTLLNTWRKELYTEAALIDAEDNAAYYPTLDLLIIHPEPILHYMMARAVPLEHVVASQDMPYVEQMVSSLHYPYFLAGHFVFWDFGDTKLHQEIQRYFRNMQLMYDKATDGKFSYEDFIAQNGLRHFVFRQKLAETFERMVDLQIPDIEAAAAILIATKAMIPVPELAQFQLELPTLDWIDQHLIKRSEKDPQNFLQYVKRKVDSAYSTNKPVFNLL
jgi:hypothetical protein